MYHLESAFKGKNNWWRYLVMFATILIVSNTIGSIPLVVALAIKSNSDPAVFSQFASNPNNLSITGLDANLGFLLLVFPFIAGLIAFILLIKPLNNRTFRMTINGDRKIRWNRFLISGLVWLLLSALYLFVYLKFDPSNFVLTPRTSSIMVLTLISILFIPFQAAFEEVLFRGYLMQGFATLMRNRWFPLIMTSLFFGLLHAFNPEVKQFGFFTMIPQYIFFGLIFGIVTILDDGIEASMGAHAANNVFLCIMLTTDSSALQTPALYEQHTVHPWTEFGALIISGIIFIMILKYIFKWGSFSLITKNIQVPEEDFQRIQN